MGPALIEPDHAEKPIADVLDYELAAMGPALIEPDHFNWCRLE